MDDYEDLLDVANGQDPKPYRHQPAFTRVDWVWAVVALGVGISLVLLAMRKT